jgi:N-acetylglutamate synthase
VRGLEKRIEELSFNAWPSLQTMVYDGWLLKFGEGYTRRSNSISPLYASETAFEEKLANCEKLYNSMGLSTIFKIADKLSPDGLDKLLAEKGYWSEAPTSVQLLDLLKYKGNAAYALLIRNKLEDEWLANMQRISGNKSNSDIELEGKILGNIVPEKYFAELQVQGEIVACGLGVIEDGYIGIYDIMVAKEHRGKGFGRYMVEGLLNLGRSKAVSWAYLQVMLDNPLALNLYDSLGFKEIYKYWYRVKKLQV